nr:reverse transcriptase domain-containing protein [Tanacetum cinerariifolium]GEY22662.1 reverse transcriptase domain-containing protein [Tanacetum cinerariifolium]
MLKALLSNKEKLQELPNTPLNENCSAVILKKLPKKLEESGKFLIPCGFSELKCKALADLGASINLMPLYVWKKLGLPELISTRMTLELAYRAICTPAGIAKDVFVLVGKFTFPSDFVIVDYESDPRVPPYLRKTFLTDRSVDALPSTNNEDKVFNLGILIQEKPFEIITRVVQDKKLAISNASLVLEDFDPHFYEPLFFKEVPRSNMLLLFSSKNKEKVFKPGIHTSEKDHSSRIPELSHQGYKIFKINQIFKRPMKIFLFSCGKEIHILAVPCLHFYLP